MKRDITANWSEEESESSCPSGKVQVNYFFFGLFFFFLALLHVFHVFLIEEGNSFSRFFFYVYAIAQSGLETVFLIFAGDIFRRFFPKWFFSAFIIGAFVLLIGHAIDFPLMRLMDMSFWDTIGWISQESWDNFIELLYASNVTMKVWLLTGGLIFLAFVAGLLFYRFTDRLSNRKPWFVTSNGLAIAIFSLVFFLFVWDGSTERFTDNTMHERYQRALPWKSTFFPIREEFLMLRSPLKNDGDPSVLALGFDPGQISLVRKPDIFLFIVESLRDDFITEEVAPNSFRFRTDNISFPQAFSNANGTHLSWFSIFYSQLSFHWAKVRQQVQPEGGIALQVLKKLGYKIHVYSSSRLSYYQMDRVLFGAKAKLADTLNTFSPDHDGMVHEGDRKAVEKLLLDLSDSRESSGRLFVIFLDSTHLNYSWPEEETKFVPCEKKINYFVAASSKSNLEKIRNRYRNALHYVDKLFGDFMAALEKTAHGKEAVVVFTADHGEEFYENGHIFHASNLSHPQIHIPIYYKFGEHSAILKEKACTMTSHIDIFPTLLHYLTDKEPQEALLQGESVFKKDRWPYAVTVRYNASRAPSEFCIHNGSNKLILRFRNDKNIFASDSLQIISTKNSKDENLSQDVAMVEKCFGPALEKIFTQ
ncbi:MAG TPA: sulfatase-like hydrolase/transferase [Rhabdochlamydiaceae bacterium]|nr:sulfatase-like hydrolase/transferase [Rhabdochlamydiaceae bacterium]